MHPKLAVSASAMAPRVEFTAAADLPVFALDVKASMAQGRLMIDGRNKADISKGLIIEVPTGADVPAAWWGLRVKKNTRFQDGARVVLRSADPMRQARLFAPGNEGVLELQNLSDKVVAFDIENLRIKAGKAGDAVRIDRVDAANLRNLKISGGKNGVFATHHPTDITMSDCEVSHAGRQDGYTHNCYLGYVRSVILRDCYFHSPASPGHAFKCYSQWLDARGCTFSHYESVADRVRGYFGKLPLLDRGAWGQSLLLGNRFVRRGWVRPTIVDLRNRAFPPGFRPHVKAGWGTQEVPFAEVDNSDPANHHLFKHALVSNVVENQLTPDDRVLPSLIRRSGTLVRNNGSAPWLASVPGKQQQAELPLNWDSRNERTVAYLVDNRVEGIPLRRLAQGWAHRRPSVRTPVRMLDQIPAWLQDWIDGPSGGSWPR